jgi:RNA polymerase sigma-70 factor (ECF subfamily)
MTDPEHFRQLLAGARGGDSAAAAELSREFGPYIRAAVRRRLHPRLRGRFDSLDFVQDVWASFLGIPPDRYSFDTPQGLVGLLTQIANNKMVEVFRHHFHTQKNDITREHSIPEGEDGAPEPIPSGGATPSQWAIAGEAWDRLLARFPEGHRAILALLRDGHSYEEIAQNTGVSLSTVNRVIRRLKDLTGL